MKRSLIPGVAFAATLGLSSLGLAQGNPAAPPPVQSAIGNGPVTTYGPYSMPPPDVVGTRRDGPASPSCGAANPQGGAPTSTTWGSCP